MLRFIDYLTLLESKVDDLKNKNPIGLAANLKEYLLPKQSEYLKKEVNQTYPQHDNFMLPKDRTATDHFFGEGNDHIKEPLKNYDHDKSEIHQAVERHLNKPITHEEYTKGTISDQYGRQVKLGKLITDPKLRNEFASDNTRSGVKQNQQHYVSVVRGVEVGGQTNSQPNAEHPNGHSWGKQSCKNVNTGSNRRYLPHEIAHGTVLVRVHDHTGQEIYRASLQPHHNESGDTAYAMDAEYGVKHPSFTAHAHDVAKRLSGEYKPGLYRKNKDVYRNNDKDEIIHPNTDSDHITNILKNENNPKIKVSALNNPNATVDHITHVLTHENDETDPYGEVRLAALQHPKLTADHITHVITHEKNNGLRSFAMSNPNVKEDHITHVLTHENKETDPWGTIRSYAIKHPNATADHITHVITHENDQTDPQGLIRSYALSHKNVNIGHINYVLSHANDQTDPKRIARFAAQYTKDNRFSGQDS